MKGDLLDQIPDAKLQQIVAMLRAGARAQLDQRELAEVTVRAWRDGYRSVVGLHDRAVHILDYGVEP
jgi:hypothetical protein